MKGLKESKQNYEVFKKEILPHYRNLYLHICKFVRDPELAKDILQDAYMKAFHYIHQYEPGTNGLAWVHTILKNTMISGLRKLKSRGWDDQITYEVAENFGLLSNYAKRGTFHESLIDSGGLGDRLLTAFQTLNPKHRTVMILYELYGYNYAEVGEILGIPDGTVRSRLHRAKKNLKSKFLEIEDE